MKKADKLFGSYRNVMLIFAMYSMVYAWIELVTSPKMHIYGPVFIVMMDSPLKYEKWIGNDITCLYCGAYALVISLLAAQFYYRYITLCRPWILKIVGKYKLIPLFIPCLIGFVLWFEFVYYGMANTVEKQEYLKEELKLYYDEDSTKVSFIAPMYWRIGKNGERIWNIGDLLGAFGCFFIIVITFATISFCALNIYWFLMKKNQNSSPKAIDINRQIFRTLVYQTLLPFLLMNCPVGLLLTFPLFEVHTGKLSNIVGASAAVYPALEPLIAMFCITSFRKTVMCHRKTETNSTGPRIICVDAGNQFI